MSTVGVFRMQYPWPSETFIGEQMRLLSRYRPVLMTRTRRGPIAGAFTAVSDEDPGNRRQRAFGFWPRVRHFRDVTPLHQVDLLHAHFGPDATYVMALARELDVPFLVTFHGFDVTVRRGWMLRHAPLWTLRYVLLEPQLKRAATTIIAVSQFLRQRLLERGYPEQKVVVHYIGVDTTQFVPAPDRGAERIVLNVARHTVKKGVETLLRAFQLIAHKHPGVRLVQVGSGSLSSQLQHLTAQLGIADRVTFLGAQPHETVKVLMQQAEIFALASRTARNGDSESLGIVCNEASASGRPIVATSHGGIPEAVRHGETGLLAPEGDAAGVAAHLDTLLADRGLGDEMGRRGREFACDVFDLRTQCGRLETLYDGVVNSARTW